MGILYPLFFSGAWYSTLKYPARAQSIHNDRSHLGVFYIRDEWFTRCCRYITDKYTTYGLTSSSLNKKKIFMFFVSYKACQSDKYGKTVVNWGGGGGILPTWLHV